MYKCILFLIVREIVLDLNADSVTICHKSFSYVSFAHEIYSILESLVSISKEFL